MRTTAVISSKGQVVIPANLRRRFGLTEGSTVVFQEENGSLTLASSSWDELLALAGSLRGLPLEEELERERKAERKREDRAMKDYVLDANAVLRYFKVGNAGDGDGVLDLFLQAQRNQARLSISVVNMGEVFYVLLRNVGEQRALHYIRVLQHGVTIVDADVSRTIRAATLKHRYKLGYADSFAAALALDSKATLVSADPTFRNIGKSLKWMRLPKFTPTKR